MVIYMPSCYLHNMLYKEVIKQNNIIFRNKNLIKIGAQGPDIFFYYHRIFMYRNIKYMEYGEFLHKNDIENTFINMIKYAQKIENEELKNDLFSYIFGYGLHYILDRTFHPYVNNFIKKNNELNICNHLKFEANLDVFLAYKNNEKVDFNKLLKIPKKEIKKISLLYKHINSDLKNNTYLKAYNEMILIRNLTKNGVLIKKILKLIGLENSVVDSAVYPKNFIDNIDILNISNKKYYDNLNVYQMFNNTIIESIDFYNILKYYYFNNNYLNYDNLINFIGNKDFNGNFYR